MDVFFVISGFVITGSLLRQLDGGLSLLDFYAARARRILPMGTLVLAGTVFASWYLLNFVRADRVAMDGVWAGLFAANVRFSSTGADYFESDLPPSPLQHYWSLAVEEQFYVVWPVLLLLFVALAGRLRGKSSAVRTTLVAVALGLVIAGSLAWSIVQTGSQPTAAYFSTFTRAWELAVGCLLAVGSSLVARVPATIRAGLAWAGLAGVAAAGTLFSPTTAFPGSAALLPVLSAAAIVAGGIGRSRAGAGVLLSLAPLRAIGDWSYSFYLLHWPLLVLAAGYAGHELGLKWNLALLGAALALSYGTYRLVESPFRSRQWIRKNRADSLLLWPTAVLAVMCASLFVSTSVRSERDHRAAQTATAATSLVSGPATGRSQPEDPAVAGVQAAVVAANADSPIPVDLSPPVEDIATDDDRTMCFADQGQSTGRVCKNGDTNATRSIALIGDSHAMMWFPALDAAARKHHWVLYPMFKPNCTLAPVRIHVPGVGVSPDCDRWQEWAASTLKELRPDRLVFANYTHHLADGSGRPIEDLRSRLQRWKAGVGQTVKAATSAGGKAAWLGDAPGLAVDPTECLLKRRATLADCTFRPSAFKAQYNAATREAAEAAGGTYVGVDQWFCSEGQCPTVMARVVAYSDTNHVSRTYSRRLSEPLAKRLGLR